MKKKLVSVLVAGAMLAAMLTGCGGGSGSRQWRSRNRGTGGRRGIRRRDIDSMVLGSGI